MEIEEKLITSEEVERPTKSAADELETETDSTNLDEDSEIKTEDADPEPEQALEFLTGGERYIQD